MNKIFSLVAAVCLLVAGVKPANAVEAKPATKSVIEFNRAAADAVLTNRHTFAEGLSWIGSQPPPATESAAVQTILAELHTGAWLADAEQFLETYPQSAWAPSLHHAFASFCRRTGRTTKALNHWEASWETLRANHSPESQQLAAAVLGSWLQLLSSLGRMDQLERLLPEAEALERLQPGMHRQVMSAKANYHMMLSQPGRSFRCGTLALKAVGLTLQNTNTALANLVSVPSPTNGFSLEQLERLATELHLGLVAAERPSGSELVVPSVVHWRQNHYAALLAQKGDSIYVSDPTFETAKWIPASVVNEEASGAFLVPGGKLPAGWLKLGPAKAAKFRGQGLPENVNDGKDCGCPKGKKCPACKGMPVWWVTEPFVNLFIADEPLSYLTSKGEEMSFRFTYKQRDTRPNLDSSRDGWVNITGWNHTWFSYIRTTSKTSYAEPYYWIDYNDSTSVIYLPGGGELNFDGLTGTDPETGIQMQPCSPNYYFNLIYSSYVSQNGLGGLRLIYPDGTQDIYAIAQEEFSPGNDYPRYDFLWTRRITPNGDVIQLTYTLTDPNACQVQYVIDPDGKTNTFHYNSKRVVSQVDNPYGKSAFFTYDSNTNLVSITDSETNTSTLTYYTNGYPQTLTTPYGTNTFNILEQEQAGIIDEGNAGGHDFITRAITTTDAAGGTDLYLYRYNFYTDHSWMTNVVPSAQVPVGTPLGTLDDGTTGTNVYNYVSFRNSFHWNARQYGSLSTTILTNLTVNDYSRGHRSHWLEDTNELTLSNVLSWEQEPSPDGSTDGLVTFYDYPGKTANYQEGTSPVPAVTAWRYPGGATYYEWRRYNSWGFLTNLVATYTKTDGTVGTRTNSWIYASNTYTNSISYQGYVTNTTWTIPNLLTAIIGPDGLTTSSFGTFDPVYWPWAYVDSSGVTNNVTISSRRVIPASITNGVNDVTQLYFTGLNKVAGVKWPTTLTTTNFYDTNGFLAKTVDVEPTRTNSFTYGDNGLVITWTDPLNHIQTNTWDTLLRLRSASDERGYVSNSYTSLSLTGQRDRLGNWKYYGYDAANRPTAITNELGQKTFFGWCLCGSLETITNAVGEVTTLTHDQQSRLVGLTFSTSPSIAYAFTLDAAGRMTNATDSANASYQFLYNNQGLLTTISNASGTVAKALFDVRDRPLQVTGPGGTTATNTFDLLNRILTRQLPLGNPERFGYVAAGLAKYTNQLGFITSFGYDPSGLLTSQTNANSEIIRMAYDDVGNLTTLTDGKSQQTTWQFDKFGRVTNKVDNAGATAFKYSYDANDRLTNRWTPAKGNTAYTYDNANRLVSVGYPSMGTVTTAFDALGRLTNLVDALGTTKWTYSRLGAVASEDGPWDADRVTSTYSLAHRLTALNIARPNTADWVQSFGYDAVGRMTNIASPAGIFNYAFLNASTLVTQLGLGNGAKVTNGYDSDLRLTSTWLRNGSGTALNSHSYGYNDAHWRTSLTNFAANRWSYGYDNVGQLTAANGYESGGAIRASEQFGYSFDAAGNLSTRTNYALQQTLSVDGLNQLSSASRTGNYSVAGGTLGTPTGVTVNGSAATLFADGSFVRTNVSLTSGSNTFTAVATDALSRQDTSVVTAWLPATNAFAYDGNGNLTSDGYRGFVYDDDNRLTSVTITNASRSEFVFDGLGRQRIRREYIWVASTWLLSEEVHLVYDGSVVVQERDRYNAPLVTYTRGLDLSGSRRGAGGIGGLLARTDHGTSLNAYYHSDAGGNVVALTDGLQNVVARYAYDPFGGTLQASGPLASANCYRFSSKEFHPGSGTYSYGFRQYDPTFQRWLNRDPLQELGGINQYGFAGNNAVANLDTDGRFVVSLAFLALDLGRAFNNARNGNSSFSDGLWVALDLATLAADVFTGVGGDGAQLALAGARGVQFAEAARALKWLDAGDAVNAAVHLLRAHPADALRFCSAAGHGTGGGEGSPSSGGAEATESGANSAMQARNLARQLTSEEQTAQALAGKGEPIFGAGTSEPLTSANRLAQQYGGNPADWTKMGGENSAVRGVTTPAGNNFEIHWYQNVKTGQIVELKTKIAGH